MGLGRIARRLRRLPLLIGVGEDRRSVLRPDVPALPVQRGRVVDVPEVRQKLLVGYDGRVERHFDRLGVAGGAGADLLIGRMLSRPAGVARHGIDHALDLAERVLDAPEAARCERGLLHQFDPLLGEGGFLNCRHWFSLATAPIVTPRDGGVTDLTCSGAPMKHRDHAPLFHA